MTQQFYSWLVSLIAANDVHPFYISGEWESKRNDVLKIDKDECQICKSKGKFKRAALVHHIKHLKTFPSLALDIWYTDSNGEKQRNLISVCKRCHETVCHPERMRKRNKIKFQTEERWD